MERTYVVTGAASGIGAATSQMLKAAGNKVVGVDIHNTDVTADLGTVHFQNLLVLPLQAQWHL